MLLANDTNHIEKTHLKMNKAVLPIDAKAFVLYDRSMVVKTKDVKEQDVKK